MQRYFTNKIIYSIRCNKSFLKLLLQRIEYIILFAKYVRVSCICKCNRLKGCLQQITELMIHLRQRTGRSSHIGRQ